MADGEVPGGPVSSREVSTLGNTPNLGQSLVHTWCTLTRKWGYVCATESGANY